MKLSRRFEWIYRLHLQDRRVGQATNEHAAGDTSIKSPADCKLPRSLYDPVCPHSVCSACLLHIEFLAWLILRRWRWRRYVSPKRRLTFHRATWRYVPENGTHHNHQPELQIQQKFFEHLNYNSVFNLVVVVDSLLNTRFQESSYCMHLFYALQSTPWSFCNMGVYGFRFPLTPLLKYLTKFWFRESVNVMRPTFMARI
jgi:hypothetical protein